LVVTVKNFDGVHANTHGRILVFAVNDNGLLAPTPVVTQSPDPSPFGFMFDQREHLLVTEAVFGPISSYDVISDGTLEPISRSVPNGQLAMCWIDGNHRYVYVSNTLSFTLTGYALHNDGTLTLLNDNGITVNDGVGRPPLDVKVTLNG